MKTLWNVPVGSPLEGPVLITYGISYGINIPLCMVYGLYINHQVRNQAWMIHAFLSIWPTPKKGFTSLKLQFLRKAGVLWLGIVGLKIWLVYRASAEDLDIESPASHDVFWAAIGGVGLRW